MAARASDVDPSVLLGGLAAALTGAAPATAALRLLVDGLGLTSAVLRRSGAPELLAVAGDVVHAVPSMRPAVVTPHAGHTVELPVPGAPARAVAVLVVVGARPSQLPVLRAAAAVLGLALDDAAPSALADEAGALLLEADEDGDLLADALHDGPVQAMVAARYACDAAVRGGDAAVARDAVQDALVDLRRTMWHLRPRGGEGLPDALAALAGRLAEAGGPPLHLVLDADAAARLAPPARALAYRLVQALARDADGPVRVGLRTSGPDVVLDVDGGRPLDGPDRWRHRLRALGGDLSSSAGRLRLSLPSAGPETDRPTPSSAPTSRSKACS